MGFFILSYPCAQVCYVFTYHTALIIDIFKYIHLSDLDGGGFGWLYIKRNIKTQTKNIAIIEHISIEGTRLSSEIPNTQTDLAL